MTHCVCVCVYVALCNGMKLTQSFMEGEFPALQRSHCLDSGSAIMGFGQITVITLVARRLRFHSLKCEIEFLNG